MGRSGGFIALCCDIITEMSRFLTTGWAGRVLKSECTVDGHSLTGVSDGHTLSGFIDTWF